MTCLHCDRTDIYAHGMCQMHYARRRRGLPMDAPPRRGGVVKNQMAHLRVKMLWGPAKNHQCVDCGGPAEEWAYDGTDPNELREARGPFSLHPEFYKPMCVPCHRAFDAKGHSSCMECGKEAHGRGLCRYHYEVATRDHRNALRRQRRANRKLVDID